MAKKSHNQNPYDVLFAFDRLEVGPALLSPNRIVAPYTVIKGKSSLTYDLSFRYEEKVFTPGDIESENLAALVAAQPALNYGLFCDQMVFHGPYDQTDRRLLLDMAANTAREILVVKFLHPNPFLTGKAAKLEAVKLKSYLRAELEFPNLSKEIQQKESGTSTKRYGILSSGGKDSLLSFGLLKELKKEIHPVFINESGRHWYTALNSYRFLQKSHRQTGRVWTDVDRLYTWMLRHMPFIRSDFHSFRSDAYPIRLWTVAVLIFGAMPLFAKRGVGRIVLGDEFDTTVQAKHEGISHYDGLYDQSRYFDNALTRFYHRKGWGISQFSLLRPLSEFLIQKMLAKRYPELQQHQVSCHAAHAEGERFYPCGKCEKCRRIVAMLTAQGIDPGRCGYSPSQIESVRKGLADQILHQEKEGAEHLAFLLKDKEFVDPNSAFARQAKEHPEIEKIRFDKEHAPADGIPNDLRKGLYKIYLQHTNGAVYKVGRQWIDANPLADSFLAPPYRFETKRQKGKSTSKEKDTLPVDEYNLGELTWPQAKKRFKEVDVVLLPVGSIEQHGPHLPLNTDAFDAEYLAREVAKNCSLPRPLVLPLIPYGVSYHHDDFPGTIPISPDALAKLVYEIGVAVAKNGATKLIIINGHGGNIPALNFAAQNINRDMHIFTCVESGETSDPDIADIVETTGDVHAGEIETSTTLAIRPERVHPDKAIDFVPKFSSKYLNFSSRRGVEWHTHIARISPTGTLGAPRKASVEKGKKIWDVMIRNLVEFVEDIKKMSLDEIYQRRL